VGPSDTARQSAYPERTQAQPALRMNPAERELGAFLTAVRQNFGPDAVPRAIDCWLEAFADAPSACLAPRELRAVTIHAASRLAAQVLHAPAQS
jgi:hypothetical protein